MLLIAVRLRTRESTLYSDPLKSFVFRLHFTPIASPPHPKGMSCVAKNPLLP